MRVRIAALASLVVVVAASAAHAEDAAPGGRTIAVLPLRADALQLNEAQRLNLLVRQRAKTRGGYDVQGEETTTQLLEASQNLGLDCDVNAAECGTQIGRIADVDFVLMGRATGGLVDTSKPGTSAMVGVDLRLIDVKKGAELRHVSALVPTDASLQVTAMNELSELLYGDGALVALEIVALPPGCEVRVDGVPRGTSPLPLPVDSLAPGVHHVSISKRGYLTSNSNVNVQKGEAARLEVTLEVDPESVHTGPTTLDIAIPFVVAGAGAALAVGGGVMTFIGLDPWFRYDKAKSTIETADPKDDGYVATVTEQNRLASDAADQWSTWGQGVTIAGITLIGVGTLATGAGVGFGIWRLTQSGDEPAPE